MARAARLAAGWSLIVVGGVLLVLPGPGIPIALAGLALVGREQRWARRLLGRLRARWRQATAWSRRRSTSRPA